MQGVRCCLVKTITLCEVRGGEGGAELHGVNKSKEDRESKGQSPGEAGDSLLSVAE